MVLFLSVTVGPEQKRSCLTLLLHMKQTQVNVDIVLECTRYGISHTQKHRLLSKELLIKLYLYFAGRSLLS